MQVELRNVLGEAVAKTLMDHLPPNGWADVVRKSDLDWFQKYVDLRFSQVDARLDQMDKRLDQIDARIDQLENRVDKRFTNIVAAMWAMTGIFTTAFIGLFSILITKL